MIRESTVKICPDSINIFRDIHIYIAKRNTQSVFCDLDTDMSSIGTVVFEKRVSEDSPMRNFKERFMSIFMHGFNLY